jgi:hypothetical protein
MKIRVLAPIIFLGAVGAVFAQPVIVTQPVNQTNYVGATVTMTVVATGTPPISYQWQRYSSNFTDLPGQTNALLTLMNAQTNYDADYRVVVTDRNGANNSAVAHLYVMLRPLLVISQPSPGLVTLSWPGGMALLLSRSIDCPAWVLVGGTSPATLSLDTNEPFQGGIAGSQWFFKLMDLPAESDLEAEFEYDLDSASHDSPDAATRIRSSEACIAAYLLLAPTIVLPGYTGARIRSNPYAEEALGIGQDLGGSCTLTEEAFWLQYINFLTYGP